MKFSQGILDGTPIGIGYFAVSFSFGIAASKCLSPAFATLVSMTNLTSAGQFAGMQIMAAAGSFAEMALATLFINLRYSLMAVSLSQKVSPSFGTGKRLLLGFCITDEIYAVAMGKNSPVNPVYFLGLSLIPYLGWTCGTLCGAVAGEILPKFLSEALGVALYGMFIAIVIPQMRLQKSVSVAVAIAVSLSTAFFCIPILQKVSVGFSIILCSVVASLFAAKFFPLKPSSGESA